jgi:hypothetical protein
VNLILYYLRGATDIGPVDMLIKPVSVFKLKRCLDLFVVCSFVISRIDGGGDVRGDLYLRLNKIQIKVEIVKK